ncbi:MAG: 4Fe-4S binding protein [Clostridia bacterium]|nr:4Fe-4S binding protein [Clostridia bacterium]
MTNEMDNCFIDRIPSEARLRRGRAAVCLCPGQDKCGLCVGACGFGAIAKTERVPKVDHDECIACGACVRACPFGNMRLVDFTKGEDTAELQLKIPKLLVKNGLEGLTDGDRIRLFSACAEESEDAESRADSEVLQAHYLDGGELSLRIRTDKANAFIPFRV